MGNVIYYIRIARHDGQFGLVMVDKKLVDSLDGNWCDVVAAVIENGIMTDEPFFVTIGDAAADGMPVPIMFSYKVGNT